MLAITKDEFIKYAQEAEDEIFERYKDEHNEECIESICSKDETGMFDIRQQKEL